MVIDSSVVLKWFEDEQDGDLARDLYVRLKKGEADFASSSFLLVECANVLLGAKRLSKDLVWEAVEKIAQSGIEFVDLEMGLVSERLVRVASMYGLSVYDSIYVDLAMRHGVKLLTADKKLLEIEDVGVCLKEVNGL